MLMQQYLEVDRGVPLENRNLAPTISNADSECSEMLTEDLMKLNFLDGKRVHVFKKNFDASDVEQISAGKSYFYYYFE